MTSKPTQPQYYVTISPLSRKGAREPEATFELWDSNNYFAPITTSASANLPVCIVQIPRDILPPNQYVHPDIRPPTYIISSNGSITLDLDAADPICPEEYFNTIALTMFACLNIQAPTYTSPAVCTFSKNQRGSEDHPQPEINPDDAAHGRTRVNLGKMFVDSRVSAAGPVLDAPGYMAVVDWPIPLGCDGRERKTKPVVVLTYTVTAWTLMSAQLPKTRYIHPREPMARNLCQFVLLKRGSDRMSSTQKY